MKIVAIIQGRMSSRRLPGKVLEDVAGSPLIAHVLRRTVEAGVFDAVVVATSTDKSDDPLEKFCQSEGVACFRGNLTDVLDRYYQAAIKHKAQLVVRLTADCPLLDPAVIRTVVRTYDPALYDYVSNVQKRTFPKGLDTEIFHIEALERAHAEAKQPEEREHVTPYIRTHEDIFRIGSVTQKQNLSALRWTVDEPADLEFVRAVYRELGDGAFGQEEILALLQRRPDIQKINEGISSPGSL